MIRRTLILAWLAASAALPQANQMKGTWSAASGAETMVGSWTARLDTQADVAWGAWRLMAAGGQPSAGGAWSARKVSGEWRGSWRGQTQSNESVTGTWTAKSSLPGTGALNELIQSAMTQIVGGTWTQGGQERHMVDPDRAEVIVYTIGHSNHPLEYCVDLLRRWEIEIVADVRTQPYSRWVPHFSREALRSALAGRGIGYWYLGQALGGKRDAGYSEIALRADFQAAIDELAGSAQRTRITVMCAEEDPRRCHRHLLLSPALRRLGAGVRHIRGDGSLERDEDLTPPSLFPRSGALILSPR